MFINQPTDRDISSLHEDSATQPIDDLHDPNPTSLTPLDTDFDLDDILPRESFPTRVSPAASLVDGVASRTPAVSLFTNEPLGLESIQHRFTLPSPPKTPVGRAKEDIPGRYSDVEDTPPLRAAGFVGKEISALDSDGEREPLPTLGDLPTRLAVNQAAGETDGATSNDLQIAVEKTKEEKKTKGVLPVGIADVS
jgi:hypothetical protein